jgi:hypothetical protein
MLANAFGNELGNSIVQGLASQPKANNKSTNTNQTDLDLNQPASISTNHSSGVNASQGA